MFYYLLFIFIFMLARPAKGINEAGRMFSLI